MRTAEVVFVGDARSLIRASQEAASATESATGKIAASNERIGASSAAMASRTAAAHDKAISSAKQSAEAFGKWGSIAGVGVIAASVKMATSVESAATAIAKAAGTSTAGGKQIETAFRTIPGTVEYSAAKIGAAFATIAGELKVVEGHALTAAQAMKVMKAALDLADASGEDLKTSTEALGKVMLTFHLGADQAAKASDVLFNASKVTGISLQDLTTLVDKARGRLGALAPSLEETTGLMAELAKQGVAGRLTMGALGGAFGTLLSQSKPVNAVLKELNVHVFNSKGGFVGLKSVIEQLHPALSKYTQASQLAATRVLFGEKANKQLLEVIHQGPAAYNAATAAVSRHGTAANAAAKQHATMEGRLKATKADLENMGATIGERLLPIMSKMVGGLSDGIKWLDKHKTAAKALAIVMGTVLGAAMLDFAVVKVAKVIGGIDTMIGGMKALGKRMWTTAGEVGAADAAMVTETEAASVSMKAALMTTGIGAAVVALGTAAYVLSTKWKQSMEALETATKSAANFVIDSLNELIQKVNEFTDKISFGLIPKIHELGHVGEGSGGSRGSGLTPTQEQGTEAVQKALQGPASLRGAQGGGIMSFFISKGLTRAQAAGIVGNMMQESSLNPQSPGGGLIQGQGGRTSSGTTLQQLEGVWRELTGAYRQSLADLKKTHTPQEAARIFSKEFEKPGIPNLPARERYAREALGAHPSAQEKHSSAMEKHSKAMEQYGSKTLPTEAGKAKKAPKPEDLTGQIDRWAEQSVGKFAESWGKNTGPELDKLQSEFHTHAAAWCAEFATTAAMFGGASKAVRTASVATIREWAEAGTHGYRRGVGHTPHVGDLMMFGNEHVGFVQSVHGSQVTTIEGNTSAGKVSVGHRAASEGTFASPIYHSLKTGKVLLDTASKEFGEAVKKAEHLLLTAGQQATVGRLLGQAAEAHETATMYGGYATEAGEAWERTRPRQEQKRKPLDTARGAGEQTMIDQQDILTAQAKKKYYEREVVALGKEAKAWAKLRDQYRSFARHAHAGAKKDALNKAAAFDGKVKQAQAEAKALNGTIADTEMAIEAAQEVLSVTLPGEVQAADLGAYQAQISKIDLEQRAEMLTPEQAQAQKKALAEKAIGGGFGALSPEGLLQIKGDLVEFAKTVQDANSALAEHNKLQAEANKLQQEQIHAAERIAEIELASATKTIADLVSGEIAGRGYAGRAMTAGSGSAARY